MRFDYRLTTVGLLLAVACQTPFPSPASTPSPSAAGGLSPATPLTARQRRWVDSTLATLSLRERVGQMVMVWVLGDYTTVHDSSYAEVIRWVERDDIRSSSARISSPASDGSRADCSRTTCSTPAARPSFRRRWRLPPRGATATRTTSRARSQKRGAPSAFTSTSR